MQTLHRDQIFISVSGPVSGPVRNLQAVRSLQAGLREVCHRSVSGHRQITARSQPAHSKSQPVHNPLTAKSQPVHSPLTGKSQPVHNPLTANHSPSTARSQANHTPLTGKSYIAHNQITTRSQGLQPPNLRLQNSYRLAYNSPYSIPHKNKQFKVYRVSMAVEVLRLTLAG